MYNILSKYNFVTILPFEKTFFYSSPLLKDIKFSKELLRLNYLKYAPYTNSNILSVTENKQLMIWFYQENINIPIILPESYLVFKELKNRVDSIYVIYDEVIKIIVIKSSQLLSAFTLDSVDDRTIELTMDEYQLSSRVDIKKTEYENLKQSALNSLTVKELYKFNQLDLDKKAIVKKFVDKASYPLSALVAFAIIVSYTQSHMLKSEIENLTEVYEEKKTENREIKKFIKEHNFQVEKWKGFIENELLYVEPTIILDTVYRVFKTDDQAHLTDISISGGKMHLKIQTDMNPIVFLNRLNEIKYFLRVVIQNTHKPRNAMKIISYDIDVKPIKDL